MKKYIRIVAGVLMMALFISGCGNENTQSENQNEVMHNTEIVQEEDTQKETETIIVEVETTMYAQKRVNVRSLPSTDGEKLGILSINDEVVALGEAVDGWQKVRYNDSIAYVSVEYLSLEKIEIQTPEPGTTLQSDEITA